MNRRQFIIFLSLIFFLQTQILFAGPILYRVQMKKAMEQRQRLQVQQVVEAHEHPYVVIDEQQRPPTYQEAVDRHNQAIAQAIRHAHQTSGGLTVDNTATQPASPTFFQSIILFIQHFFAMVKHFIDGLFGLNLNDELETPAQPGAPQTISTVTEQPPPSAPVAVGADAQELVDLSEVWKKLDKKATVWALLPDDQSKLLTVAEYISRFQKQGVKISAPPLHYAQAIDQMAQSNPQMLQRPFGELLQVMAIVEYDFDNGMDKDALAKQVLGDEGYESNKKRIAQQLQQQQQQSQPQQRQVQQQ